MEHLQAFISDCDRRTESAKQRLAETQEELSAEVAAKANSVHELAEQIGQKLAKAEQLGEEGFVDESMKLMEEVRICDGNVTSIISMLYFYYQNFVKRIVTRIMRNRKTHQNSTFEFF